MDKIEIRYGESLSLGFDAADPTATTATIIVGVLDDSNIIEKTINLVDGVGSFDLTTADTKVAPGVYYYQINVTNSGGGVEKYPTPEECLANGETLPIFQVYRALDED